MAAKKQNDSLDEKEQISRSQQEPIVSDDDDFGLDDIDLDLISESESEEGVHPPPIAVRKCEEEEKKNRTAILITILVVLLVLAVLYFFVIKPEPEPEPEPEPVKQELPVQPEPEPEPEPDPEPPKEPQVITITQRDSRFYVVVGSFFDLDNAEDRADSIVASGTDAYVIQPLGKNKRYRVGISPTGSFSEANGLLEGLKATYGEKIWVLKH